MDLQCLTFSTCGPSEHGFVVKQIVTLKMKIKTAMLLRSILLLDLLNCKLQHNLCSIPFYIKMGVSGRYQPVNLSSTVTALDKSIKRHNFNNRCYSFEN